MGRGMKGIYRGFKYSLSNMFANKDREFEIGRPTDVKHVSHIGCDRLSGSAPSWMSEFDAGPDFSASSVGTCSAPLSPWSSQDFGDSMSVQPGSEMFRNSHPSDLPNPAKKRQRRKKRITSSNSGSSSRSSRTAEKTKLGEDGDGNPANIVVL